MGKCSSTSGNIKSKTTKESLKGDVTNQKYFPLGKSLLMTKSRAQVIKKNSDKSTNNMEVKLSFKLCDIKVQNCVIEIIVSSDLNNAVLIKDKIDIINEKEYQINQIVKIPYYFEKEQVLKVSIKSLNNQEDEQLSESLIFIADIVASEKNCFFLTDFKHIASLLIKTKPNDNDELQYEFSVRINHKKPSTKELFYLICSGNHKLYKSEEVFPNKSNDWIYSKISIEKQFFFSDHYTISIYEFENDHIMANKITEFKVTSSDREFTFEINNPDFSANILVNIREYKLFSFIDYIELGMKINLIAGIDFTGSNGHPLDAKSLHYINSKELTQYEKALTAVGEILVHYDEDQLIPLYGFGGIPNGKIEVEHIFSLKQIKLNENNQDYIDYGISSKKSLNKIFSVNNIKEYQFILESKNLNSDDEEFNDSNDNHKSNLKSRPFNDPFKDDYVIGLSGILETYRKSLNSISFSGPTVFNPLLEKVRHNMIKNQKVGSIKDYYILLILTDGQINDLKQTITSIVNLSLLPISIIIIGIGDDDFKSMKDLDGDGFPLTNFNNKVTSRDIVQFVHYNKFKNNMKLLAEEVLREVPLQVESYYHIHGINLE